MANPTTNYNWPMPTATDLVTDLPADFAAFGQPVDTTLKALNPETTLGDISYRSSTANTNTRLGIGSSGQVLSVSGGVPAWTTPAASGMTLITRQTASNVASLTIDSVFTSTYKSYLVVVEHLYATGSTDDIGFALRYGSTTQATAYYGASGSLASSGAGLVSTASNNSTFFSLTSDSANTVSMFQFVITGVGQGSGVPYPGFSGTGVRQEQGNAGLFFGGLAFAAQAYSGILFKSASTNIYATVAIYGLAAS